jgi:hypothetical protein
MYYHVATVPRCYNVPAIFFHENCHVGEPNRIVPIKNIPIKVARNNIKLITPI